MKVCVIGLRGVPDVPGGIETHCENLYDRMVRLQPDLQLTIFGRKPYIGRTPYDTDSGLRVIPAFALKNKYLEALSNTFVSILRARYGFGADIVHIHAIGPGLLAPLARLLGMKVVLTHHGDDFQRAKWNALARGVLRLGERVGVGSAVETIAVSPSLADRLSNAFPAKAEHIHHIPNGADHILGRALGAKGAVVLDKFGLETGGYIIGVGRLVPEKGFADLIRAHKRSGSGTPLVIVGGASHSDHDAELRALADDTVVLTGSLPQAEVAQLLAHSRMFVMPSHHEGLPIAALEAWAMRTKLLLSDIQPNLDLGLGADHYFKVGDIDALAERLRDEGSNLPAIPLPETFNWTSIAQQTLAIYRGIHAPSTSRLAAEKA